MTVGPWYIPITRRALDVDGTDALFNTESMEIVVAPGVSGRRLRTVLWHEIKHVLNALASVVDGLSEEEMVCKLDAIEVMFFQDNRKFMAWLRKRVK